MKPWMMALVLGRARQLVTLPPFTASGPVTIPQGVPRLESIIGKGAAGSPGGGGTPGYFTDAVTYLIKRNGSGVDEARSTAGPSPGSTPASYCDPGVLTPESPTYEGYQTCYEFRSTSIGGTSPTTGASTTGFGQTFVGGTGGAATARTVNNVAVTPGTYQLVIPSGGSIIISYYV